MASLSPGDVKSILELDPGPIVIFTHLAAGENVWSLGNHWEAMMCDALPGERLG